MAAKIIKELHGFSGNQIFLMGKRGNLFVRKIGKVDRNLERMLALVNNFPVPKIVKYSDIAIDMEYIHGLDIKTYLLNNNGSNLTNFICDILTKFKSTSVIKNYKEVYITKLDEIEFTTEIKFSKNELLEKLPEVLPSSNYHGDLTLENIIYTEDKGFYLIDCAYIEYDSYIFDIAKLRQDLEIGWFLRNSSVNLDIKTKRIQKHILDIFPEAHNDYLLILMLLRVFRHTKPNTFERAFILRGINSLWK